jgi:hypothetical protein
MKGANMMIINVFSDYTKTKLIGESEFPKEAVNISLEKFYDSKIDVYPDFKSVQFDSGFRTWIVESNNVILDQQDTNELLKFIAATLLIEMPISDSIVNLSNIIISVALSGMTLSVDKDENKEEEEEHQEYTDDKKDSKKILN